MALKWIISIDNEFRMGNVSLHRDLLISSEKKQCLGGGYFHMLDNDELLLYSSSSDFGQVTEDEFKGMLIRGGLKLKYKKLYFTQTESLGTALEEYILGKLPFIKL
jgi:hypothetical protein